LGDEDRYRADEADRSHADEGESDLEGFVRGQYE
jgi:hypothetical protein